MDAYPELLDKEDSLLLLVDVQQTMLANCVAPDRVRQNASILIDIARILTIPIILTEQNPRKLGTFLPELTAKSPNPVVFSKNQFGCFENGAIRQAIAATGRKTIILAGIEAHICIFQTGIGGIQLGYRVHVAADAVSASSQMNLDIGLGRLRRAGAAISSMEMAIFELLKKADTEEFRNVLPHIKKIAR
ncbi:MAG: isochorismatase family protein [Thermodesulfobacteriota bacterium]